MAYPKVPKSVWEEFLERISNGEAVRVICKDKSDAKLGDCGEEDRG